MSTFLCSTEYIYKQSNSYLCCEEELWMYTHTPSLTAYPEDIINKQSTKKYASCADSI